MMPSHTITVPLRYADATFADVPKNIKNAFEKLPDTRKGMYLHGGVGTGKTHIAYALMKEARSREISTRFYNTGELLREIKQDFNRPWGEKSHIDEAIMEYRGLLILDDIGAEKISDWVAETFYIIVNERYNEKLPTIFTSNLNISELSGHVGDRITSRIIEMCDVFELTGSDRRLQK